MVYIQEWCWAGNRPLAFTVGSSSQLTHMDSGLPCIWFHMLGRAECKGSDHWPTVKTSSIPFTREIFLVYWQRFRWKSDLAMNLWKELFLKMRGFPRGTWLGLCAFNAQGAGSIPGQEPDPVSRTAWKRICQGEPADLSFNMCVVKICRSTP